MGRRGVIAVAAAAALSWPVQPACAATASPPEVFYSRRTLTLVVGDDAGDAAQLAALLSRHLRRHIAGRPGIVVQHLAGAGGAKAANYVYDAAPRDGTVMLMPMPGGPLLQRLLPASRTGFRLDHAELRWLGRLATTEAVLMARAGSGMRTVEHLREGRAIACAAARMDQSALIPQVLAAALAAEIKVVRGYPGAKAMIAAFAGGECNLVSLPWSYWKAAAGALLADGTAVPLAVLGPGRVRELPRVPALIEVLPSAEDRQAMALLASPAAIGRSLALAPGVPEERAELLETALAAVLAEGALAGEARRQRIELSPADRTALRRVVNEVRNAPERVIARVRALAGL